MRKMFASAALLAALTLALTACGGGGDEGSGTAATAAPTTTAAQEASRPRMPGTDGPLFAFGHESHGTAGSASPPVNPRMRRPGQCQRHEMRCRAVRRSAALSSTHEPARGPAR